jgi:hypothetical protein
MWPFSENEYDLKQLSEILLNPCITNHFFSSQRFDDKTARLFIIENITLGKDSSSNSASVSDNRSLYLGHGVIALRALPHTVVDFAGLLPAHITTLSFQSFNGSAYEVMSLALL